MKSRLITLAAAALLVAPSMAQAQIAVLSSTVEEKTTSSGAKYSASIVIANPGTEAQTVRIYKTDYRFSCDGTSNFDDAGSSSRSNANWIALQSERVTVPAGGQVTVPYAVAVPSLDTLKGTYWSTVMVEPIVETPNEAKTGKPALAIGAVMRYAIQIATHIQSSGSRTVRFEKPVLSRTAAGAAMFDVDVLDEGERGFRPTLWIEVYDAQGTLRGKAKQTRGLLYPGTSLHQQFDLGALPSGTYKAIVFADSGDDAVFAAQYTVTY